MYRILTQCQSTSIDTRIKTPSSFHHSNNTSITHSSTFIRIIDPRSRNRPPRIVTLNSTTTSSNHTHSNQCRISHISNIITSITRSEDLALASGRT